MEEKEKEDKFNLGENEYLDFSKMDISEDAKKEFINYVTSGCCKELLKTFLGWGLKTHIEQMVKDDLSGKEFVLTFQTLESFTSRFKSLENNLVECKEKEETELQKMTNDRNCLWEVNESLLVERNALQDRLNDLEEKEDSQGSLWADVRDIFIKEPNALQILPKQFSISKINQNK